MVGQGQGWFITVVVNDVDQNGLIMPHGQSCLTIMNEFMVDNGCIIVTNGNQNMFKHAAERLAGSRTLLKHGWHTKFGINLGPRNQQMMAW